MKDCGMGQFQGRMTTEEAKYTALIWAMQAAWALGYRAVEFEGDNQNVIRIINGSALNPRLNHFLNTIWGWRDKFPDAKFLFTHRQQNQCADLLAKTIRTSPNQWCMYHHVQCFLIPL
ncbi:predicted protein [Arabidopsis lyrata subsp. lyrata]|uniref:Predicted protein n=1 Tax=Arabidopsis lyrata subsp. lyrata TaxID=81972 RepID=D7LYS8_ARALL|nr:predicted protein [Arabidopsis lyrata subsp. lyrata]